MHEGGTKYYLSIQFYIALHRIELKKAIIELIIEAKIW